MYQAGKIVVDCVVGRKYLKVDCAG